MKPNRKAVLSSKQKLQVVSDYKADILVKDICDKFGISRTYLYDILAQPISEYSENKGD